MNLIELATLEARLDAILWIEEYEGTDEARKVAAESGLDPALVEAALATGIAHPVLAADVLKLGKQKP